MIKYFNQLPVNQKLRAAAGGIALLYLLAYQFSIRNTIQAYRSYANSRLAAATAESAPSRIQEYRQQLQGLEQSFQAAGYEREQLFEEVNTYCAEYGLKLSDFGAEHRQARSDIELITNPVEVSGNYLDITRLAYAIEQTRKSAHIASLHFQLKKNLRKKENNLAATLYLQNLQPITQ